MVEISQQVYKILEDEKIEANTIYKTLSGITNDVYIVNSKYVLKHCVNSDNIDFLKHEIVILSQLQSLGFLPGLYSSKLNKDNTGYLIYEYVNGLPLYNVWYQQEEDARKKIVFGIAEMIKKLHSIDYKDVSKKAKLNSLSWADFIINKFNNVLAKLEKQNINVSTIKNIEPVLRELLAEQKLALCHNELHIDNIIQQDDQTLKLIDYGSVDVGSIDYEMLIYGYMCENPKKFANHLVKQYVEPEMFTQAVAYMKEAYPEMFDFKHYRARQRIYSFIYDLETFLELETLPENTQDLIEQFAFVMNAYYEKNK